MNESKIYTNALNRYERRKTREVNIGEVPLGGNNPIRVQSMTTVDTMDTIGSVEQSIRMIEAGCEYVRITAPSIKEAENLGKIKSELRARGYQTPLVADIHFTPNAAEVAARLVEKVRVNPGNYADKKKFEEIEYTDAAYDAEIDRIREKFTPLVKICKEHGTAMRIGTNHGSLSDRILSRYGDTPFGMVESALEFLRICEDLNYYDIVLSMKSSNAQVMVQAYRLLVQKMDEEGLQPYPLHLGVTEAGEAEDGRIKSALGIGTLLEDGIGDTVRVSLTEEPEAEAPVAKMLIDKSVVKAKAEFDEVVEYPIDPYHYIRRSSLEVENIGGSNVPRVITSFPNGIDDRKQLKAVGHSYLPELDKWGMSDQGCDYVYTGSNPIEFMLPNGLREIVDHASWLKGERGNIYPLVSATELVKGVELHESLNFLKCSLADLTDQVLDLIKDSDRIVLVVDSQTNNPMQEFRSFGVKLVQAKIDLPVVWSKSYVVDNKDEFIISATVDTGSNFVDGIGDGVMVTALSIEAKVVNETCFGILQAARTRTTKTEYISCPSCGRTLFDLQETTAMIRKRTDHLKGVKIGIMGCIVNGPGEMADADYGYVGSGKGKITLYKGQEVVKRGVPSENALDELIELIKEHGEWIEPQTIEA